MLEEPPEQVVAVQGCSGHGHSCASTAPAPAWRLHAGITVEAEKRAVISVITPSMLLSGEACRVCFYI